MELKHHTHADARDVRSLLLDLHDTAYSDSTDPFHSRERFSGYVDRWSAREDWQCVSGWEGGTPVGYAYGSKFKPGGWWKGARRPEGVRGKILGLSELLVTPQWRGKGLSRILHNALLDTQDIDFVTLLVEQRKPRVQAMYEKWGYTRRGEVEQLADAPPYAVMVRDMRL
ncbi:GNAT family N-acetyltransferase [Streptomyces daliensis]|uniref:GNAT family N-acetyltransferase n=1 Tax=Streptomyces daliensis TaxID=299421 RepID=A0A8T4INI9_9ACTN|nr:GNAT family N-acetyltransferase [Streptomyces daliensis]